MDKVQNKESSDVTPSPKTFREKLELLLEKRSAV
jgi:hypothetical protein